MYTALVVFAALTLAGALLIFYELGRGGRSIPYLADQPPVTDGPLVTVIVAARDEGPNIERALGSLLAQRYQRLEFITVNDRSTDETGEVLERMASRDPRIRVIHISHLPAGWLGKNHALHTAAGQASGEFILFTDADIVFDPDTVGRGVAFMNGRQLDHLALGPDMDSPTLMLTLVVNFFSLGFLLLFRPWHAPDPRRKEHIGVGAFNMLRTSIYRTVGGHSKIALRPDDDVKLGHVVKLAGGRQMLAGGRGAIRVRWYANVPELVRGLRKNTFAGLEYSLAFVVAAVVAQLVFNVWPFVALFVTSGVLWWLNLAIAIVFMLMYAAVASGSGSKPWLAIGYPVAALIFAWIIVAATWLTIRRGGIEWRGTFYSLAELKANRVG